MIIKSGTLISGRYRIQEQIGVGGMAVVYKAVDEKLNRVVTFKALKEEYIDNQDFVKRFTKEAQAVAGFTHPNIVSAYDVGMDGDICYIIMEYIDGFTLKELIVKNAPFTNEEVIGVSMQIASALEAAHKNNIVHRDIKPQNILVTREGNIKVTDFGIAKAATSSTITADQMGSAHYFSPEQARGSYTDDKSDIYSLGIVMFEMLTGKVPFDGESPVTLAMKHMDEPLPDIKQYNPNASESLIKIINKAAAKKISQRYRSAHELSVDLQKALTDKSGSFVKTGSYDKTSHTIVLTDADRAAIRNGSEVKRFADEPSKDQPKRKRQRPSRSAAERERLRKQREAEEEKAANRRIVFGAVITGVVIIAVITVIIAFLAGGAGANDVVMPDLLGMTQELAEKSAKENGIFLDIEMVESEELAGIVVAQNVDAGEKVLKGDTVLIQVSAGNGEVEFPDVVGKTMEEAQKALKELGITNINFVAKESTNIPSGTIILSEPEAGTMINISDEVTLQISISDSENMIEVENVLGKTESEAVEILEEQGFVVKVEKAASDQYAEGQVCAQSKDGGFEALEGSSIVIYVSTGASETPTEAPTEAPAPEKTDENSENQTEAAASSDSGSYVTSYSITVPITQVPNDDSVNVKIYEVGLDGTESMVYSKTVNKSSFPYSANFSGSGSTYKVYYNDEISAVHSYDDGGLSSSSYYLDGKLADTENY